MELVWRDKSKARQEAEIPPSKTLLQWPSSNVFLAVDNLLGLKILDEHQIRPKLIYIDPPYNTGNAFVFRDKFDQDSWLSMLYPRLILAQRILAHDGSIFISIDDKGLSALRLLMDEVFGAKNFIANIIVQTNPRGRSFDRFVATSHEYLLAYAKDLSRCTINGEPKISAAEYKNKDKVAAYRLIELRNRNFTFNRSNRPNLFYPIYVNPVSGLCSLERDAQHSIKVEPLNSKGLEGCWTWGKEKFGANHHLLQAKKAKTGVWRVYRKDYLTATSRSKPKSIWINSAYNHQAGRVVLNKLFGKLNVFDFPKSVALLKKVVQLGTGPNDLVLDFFAGSGTTGQAVSELNQEDSGNRRFILMQIPEKIDAKSPAFQAGYNDLSQIGVDRLRKASIDFKLVGIGELN